MVRRSLTSSGKARTSTNGQKLHTEFVIIVQSWFLSVCNINDLHRKRLISSEQKLSS
jgi:hypothetical protein